MSGRKWTEREIRYLENKSDQMLVKDMAKHLRRSENALICKMNKLGIRGFRESTFDLTQRQLCELMGISSRTVHYWERNGLIVQPVGAFRTVSWKNLGTFLTEHPDVWDERKVKDRELLNAGTGVSACGGYKMVGDHYWSQQQLTTLKRMHSMGCKNREISPVVGRSTNAVRQKLIWLKKHGWEPMK